jgi:hypothetical protein
MNSQIATVAVVIAVLSVGCGKAVSQEKEYSKPKVISAAPIALPSEPFYKDPDYILDATVKTESVEASVASLASSVKLGPGKTYRVEIKIFESK